MIFLIFVPVVLLLMVPFAAYMITRNSSLTKDHKRVTEGINLFDARKYPESFAYFDNLIKNGHHNCITYYFRGLCHTKRDNPNSALFDFTTALSYDNSVPEIYLERGKIYLSFGEVDRALYEFERSVFYSHGTQAVGLRYRGIALIEKGRYFQAAKFLKKAVELGDEEASNLLMTPPFQNSAGISRPPGDF